MADGVYCKCCQAFVGYLTVPDAQAHYPSGCPMCCTCAGDKSDQSKAAYAAKFKTGDERWRFGEGP